MLTFLLDRYSGFNYTFPNQNVAPEEKRKEEYFLKTMEAIYSVYARQRTGITYDDQARFETNRLYGEGRQPSEYYKRILIPNADSENVDGIKGGKQLAQQRRKAWMNIDFENIISYAPKVKDHFYGLFRDMEQDVIGYPIDKDSGMLMEDKKLELLTELKFKDEIAKMREKAGEKQPNLDFFPLDERELDLYEASGGFKLNFAKAMEKLVKHTFEISKYEQLKKHWIDDARDIGYVAGRRSEDADTGETKIDYVNPSHLIIQHSNYYDFRDSEYVGEVKPWTVTELGQYIEDDKELFDLARLYTGTLGNPGSDFWDQAGRTLSMDDIGFFKLPVLEAYFIDYEDTYEREIINKYGKRRVLDAPYGYQPKNNNDKVRSTRQRYVYTGKWVVGSKSVFEYGLAYDQERQKGKDVQLPYRVVKLTEKPVTERLRPIYDQMQIGWLKFQNAQAMAKGSGHAINVRLLDNITIGGEKVDPIDVIKFMRETGDLFYSDTDQSMGGRYEGGEVRPIHDIVGGMGQDLQEGIQKFEWAVRMIEHIAGLSDVSMGSQASQNSTATGTKLTVQGSQNVIKPIAQSIMDLKGEMARSVMFNLQLKLKDNKDARSMYEQVIGEKDVEAVVQATNRGARFGVHFEPRPTRQEYVQLYEWINNSMGAGKNGQPLLEADDALMLIGELQYGANLKDVRLKLSYKIRKRKQEQRQYEMAISRQQNQQTMQQNAQKFKQEMTKQKQDKEYDLQEQKIQSQSQERIARLKANNELKQLVYRLADDEAKREMESELEVMKINANK